MAGVAAIAEATDNAALVWQANLTIESEITQEMTTVWSKKNGVAARPRQLSSEGILAEVQDCK